MFSLRTIVAASTIASVAGIAFAADPAVTARQSHMRLNAFNIGILGAMAKGEVAYDADAATAAANNLVALSNMNIGAYWKPGTSNADLPGETRALPSIWAEGSNAGEILGQLREATAALAAVAGNGQEALGPAIGPVGAACGACHKANRAEN